jgi:hypothetical protein
MAREDPLNRRVLEQMLAGVATRQFAPSLDPLPSTVPARGTSESAVSRRFVVKTAAQLAAWRSTALDAIDVVALLIDGVHIGEHCTIVALGIDHMLTHPHARLVRSPPPIARDDQRDRKFDQPHAACEAECQTGARPTDGPPVDRSRDSRSREGLPPTERPQ